LAICLVLLPAEPQSYGRAAVRFHGHQPGSAGVGLDDSQLVLAALGALRGDDAGPAALALISSAPPMAARFERALPRSRRTWRLTTGLGLQSYVETQIELGRRFVSRAILLRRPTVNPGSAT
jgi:hypothetical protein